MMIRPACLSDLDVVAERYYAKHEDGGYDGMSINYWALERLYNAEWQKRGFQGGPQ